MVEVVEKTQQIILLDLSEAKNKTKKVVKKKAKVKLISPQINAKHNKDALSIDKVKARLDAKKYGMRLNYY